MKETKRRPGRLCGLMLEKMNRHVSPRCLPKATVNVRRVGLEPDVAFAVAVSRRTRQARR